MPVIYLLITILSVSMQSFFTKIYSNKTQKGVLLYNTMATLVALFIFAITAGFRFTFITGNFLYSLLFALSYFLAIFGLTMAIKTGPLSLTALMESYSMIIASLYGVLVLHDPVTPFMWAGFALLVVSLTFINLEPKKKDAEAKSGNGINLKWVIFVLIGFCGNGFCTVIQKMQQVWSEKTYGEVLYTNDFMMAGLLVAFFAFLVAALITERDSLKENFRYGWLPAIGKGAANGLANIFSILLYTVMVISLANALIAAGGVVLAAIFAVVIYKEKLNRYQWIGLAVGVASLVLLNL